MTPFRAVLIWTTVALYLAARILQLYADRIPSLFIVVLHVAPPAAFAILHGQIRYRAKGILIFTAVCLGTGAAAETLSLRTGFPFGEYYFTDVMGPKVFEVPILLVLAYLGIGYCSWILSLIILDSQRKRLSGTRVFAIPLLASFIMLAWDVSMEADWSTVDKAWIWRQGGPVYGVPISNFVGWYLTAYIYYQLFAFYERAKGTTLRQFPWEFWFAAIVLYAVCGFGNLLILPTPMGPPQILDATGKQWLTSDILRTCALSSVFVMGSIAVMAYRGLSRSFNKHADLT